MIRVEFDTIEDLVAFIAVIRGEEFDVQKIRELTKELNKDTSVLIEAEKKQQ